MDLKDLQSMGLVTSNPLVKRTITIQFHPLLPKGKWKDPKVEERQEEPVEREVDFYLRKMTAADQVAIAACISVNRDPIYTMLHRSVYNEKGERVFPTEEDAIGVDLVMFAGLIDEINQLNEGFGKKSQPRMKRGAKSRSPSADAASRNGKKPSPRKSLESGSNTEKNTAP
jgi:hypothetical protein